MAWPSESLRSKLTAGSLIAILAMVALPVLYAWSAQEQLETHRSVMHTIGVRAHVQEILGLLRDIQAVEMGYAATGDNSYKSEFERLRQRLQVLAVQLPGLVDDDAGQSERAVSLQHRVVDWLNSSPVNQPSHVPSQKELIELIEGHHGSIDLAQIRSSMEEFVAQEHGLLEQRIQANDAARRRNMAVVLIGSSVAILTFFVLTVWLTRSLIDPIQELTKAMERIQKGDLGARVTARGQDELGQLGHGFNAMAASLQRNAWELQKRDVQAGILQVAEVLAASNDLPHLLDRALARVLEVSHCEAGAIWIRSHEDEALRALAAIGTGDKLGDRAVRPGEGILGRVAQTQIAYFTQADSEDAPLMIQHWIGERRPSELAYVPLTAGPELVGVLTLASAGRFDDQTKNLLRIVAGQIGASIRDALFHQLLRRQAVELETRNTKLAEQQAEIERQNRELRIASQLKSEFLANMSHELRTPLTIILGFSGTLLRGAQGALNEDQADSLRRVHENARHLLSLINDILDLSKIEAGQMEVDFQPFDLASCLHATLDNFQALAASKGLFLEEALERDLPGRVISDETRIQQIVTNLLSNAVKFTEAGKVVLAARARGADQVEIEVRDTGPGIDPEDIPKIFEQFRQLDGRTTRKSGGTGLGLSIVKKLVELLGGSIEVQSQRGQGSRFLVRIPITPGSATMRPSVPPSPIQRPIQNGDGESRLILAIDDDPDFLALLRAAFQGTPFRLRVATNGREGLALAEQIRPDAITLDVMMPDMDGWSVLSQLKANPATIDIPVILLTVLQRKGLGLILGASEYLTKPIDRDRLIHVLNQLAPDRNQGTILVVDDDPDIRRMLDVELRSAGFDRIETASDGVEGLRKARESRPAVVVLDLMMPRMDGFELAARLQDDEATRGIPILVLTAKELTASEISRLNGQIEEIVQKGAMNVDALIRRLVNLVGSIGVRSR